ncbi:MAG: TonB-dependent receptor [Nitrospirae bacterium]|nr:MAG: TonB-dependent receptor [Nitrospirota bacterium]
MRRGVLYRCGVMLMSLLLSAVTAAKAEPVQKPDPVESLDPVVVSATKTPLPLRQVTSAIEVITGEVLERQKIKTVADALRLSQGLAVFSSGGPGAEVTVRMRGGTPNQTLVLIDGAIVNSTTLGYYSFANLTTENIDRIEILRGPQSMLWGADAMGGVINIITKRGAGPLQASAFSEYGSFQTIREGGQMSGQKGPVDLSVSLSRWDSTGFSAANYRRGAAERDGFRNWQASTKMGLTLPREGRLEFAFRWLNSDVNLDNISNPPRDVFGSKSRDQQFVYSGTYDQRFTSWWSQKVTLAQNQDSNFFYPGTLQRNLLTNAFTVPVGSPNETRVLTNRMEVQEKFQIAKPLLVSTGYQFRRQEGENDTGLSNKHITSNAGFVEAQLNAWDRVFATAGVRQDSYNPFGDATTYRGTAGYSFAETGTKVRGSYATGFRAPTINDLFFPNFGNPNLMPEKSRGMDAGVDQRLLSDRVRLSGGYFWNRFQNLIVNANADPNCAPFSTFLSCPRNIGSAVSKGWEASAAVVLVRDRPFMKNLEFQGQYTNTLTRDVNTSLRLSRWPVDQWSALLTYQPIEPLVTTLAVRYVGSRFNDVPNQQPMRAFDVWAFTVAYDVTKYLQAYTRVDNLFDEKYEELLNAGTPVRSVYVGVRVKYDAQ